MYDRIYFYGDSLTISDEKAIKARSEIYAPVYIAQSGKLTTEDYVYFGESVDIFGTLHTNANTNINIQGDVTVAQSGVVQVDSDLYFYANTTINGIVVLNSRLMGLEESGTLILGETARVTYEEDGLIACSSDAYIYQYCDLTIPKFESGSYNKISNEGRKYTCDYYSQNHRIDSR